MNYHNITTEDMKNGDGLRSVLWVAGCEHHCSECQNPVTWDKDGGIPFEDNAKEELLKSLEPDYIAGITFSGGDPLAPYNQADVLGLIEEINTRFEHQKTIWIYTGYTAEDLLMLAGVASSRNKKSGQNILLNEILWNTDVLVDGEYKQDLRDVSLKWRGSSNQRVIDMKKSLESGEIKIHCE